MVIFYLKGRELMTITFTEAQLKFIEMNKGKFQNFNDFVIAFNKTFKRNRLTKSQLRTKIKNTYGKITNYVVESIRGAHFKEYNKKFHPSFLSNPEIKMFLTKGMPKLKLSQKEAIDYCKVLFNVKISQPTMSQMISRLKSAKEIK